VNTVLAHLKISHILDSRWLVSGLLDDPVSVVVCD